MKRLSPVVAAVAILATMGVVAPVHAIDPSALMGLSPEQMQQVIQNEQESDRFMLELIRERNRQIEQQRRNPFAGCLSLGEVRGPTLRRQRRLGGSWAEPLFNTSRQQAVTSGRISTTARNSSNNVL